MTFSSLLCILFEYLFQNNYDNQSLVQTAIVRNRDKLHSDWPFGLYADIASLQDMKFYGAIEIHFDVLV